MNDLGGAGIARSMAMNGANGWYSQCATLVSQGKFSTQDQCLQQNSAQIDTDVNQWNTYINNQNTNIEAEQQPYTTTNSVLGVSSSLFGSNVNTNQFMLGSSSNPGYISQVDSAISSLPANTCPTISNPSNLVSSANYQGNDFSLTDARSLQLYSTVLSDSSSSATLKAQAQSGLCSTLTSINSNVQNQQQVTSLQTTYGVNAAYVVVSKDAIPLSVTPSQLQKFSAISSKFTLPSTSTSVPNILTGTALESFPSAMLGETLTDIRLCTKIVGGLWHLEGQKVAVVADGWVEANPLDEEMTVQTVVNGTITLSDYFGVINVFCFHC